MKEKLNNLKVWLSARWDEIEEFFRSKTETMDVAFISMLYFAGAVILAILSGWFIIEFLLKFIIGVAFLAVCYFIYDLLM